MKILKRLSGKIEMHFVNKWLREALTPIQRAQVLNCCCKKSFEKSAAMCLTKSFTAGEYILPHQLVALRSDGKVYSAK